MSHALTNEDGIGHYKGNFGNLLFFWDVLFGTAHITRKYPAKTGLQDDILFGPERWTTQMFYPLVPEAQEPPPPAKALSARNGILECRDWRAEIAARDNIGPLPGIRHERR